MTGSEGRSRDTAEEALRQGDWRTAFEHYATVCEAGGPALEWLAVMEEAALRHARAGDLMAQRALGSIGTCQYMSGSPPEVEALHRGLKWIVAALRQEPSPSGLQLLVVWHGTLRSHGVHDDHIDAFLAEPEPREMWRRMYGAELP
jgi:hypothetical protein